VYSCQQQARAGESQGCITDSISSGGQPGASDLVIVTPNCAGTACFTKAQATPVLPPIKQQAAALGRTLQKRSSGPSAMDLDLGLSSLTASAAPSFHWQRDCRRNVHRLSASATCILVNADHHRHEDSKETSPSSLASNLGQHPQVLGVRMELFHR